MFVSRTLPTLLLLATLSVAAPAGATGEDQAAAAAAAADWIEAELAAPKPSFDLFGVAAARTDVVAALASVGGHEAALRSALIELRASAPAYIGEPGAVEPGPLAKVLLATQIAGIDPAAFLEGRDLEAELRAAMGADGTFAADVFGQALAIIALGATPGGVPGSALASLEARQCDAGDFTFLGTCPASGPDVDTTAVAIQALLTGGSDAAAANAASFLIEIQNEDGSWPNPFGEPNANSAGVAGQALRAAGEAAAADLAAGFVMSLQTADGGFKFVASDTEANGFATLQGVLALGGPAYSELTGAMFADVASNHLFAGEVAWLGVTEVSKGCNPPANDQFCPDDNVTRGQMAAFLVRALDLVDTGTQEFTDDDGSIFEEDIRRLAAAGITRGCNPPTNDQFCPDDNVTRGQMAAFLVRALDLVDTGTQEFTDDEGSIFEDDIRRLAAAGITRGCNPPTNDQFCPDDNVTRGQMAALLFRALEG